MLSPILSKRLIPEILNGMKPLAALLLALAGAPSFPADLAVEAAPHAGTHSIAPALGVRKSAVLLLQFADDTAPAYNKATMDAAFASAKKFYEEASYGQFSLAWDVFGPLVLAMDHPCDATSAFVIVPSAARTAAGKAGIDLAPYQGVVFAGTACSELAWDSADLGGPNIYLYGSGALTPQVLAHELGHNLGLYHANYLDCQVVPYDPIGSGCTSVEYGDPVDVMGTRYHHFNAVHKEILGWIHSMPVSSSGTYQIGPIEVAGAAPRSLRIVPPGSSGSVYIEFRQPQGFDLPDADLWFENVYQGATIHIAGDPTELLNLYPVTNQVALPILWGGPSLLPGMTYVDPSNRFTITPISVSPESLRVQVTILTAPQGPTLSFGQPLDGQAVYGSVPVAVTATDATGIAKVELYVDGALVGAQTQSTSSAYKFTWNATETAPNTHRLTAFAHANSGAQSSRTISVAVHVLPAIVLGASTFSTVPGGKVTLFARVSVDPNTAVAEVRFIIDGPSGRTTIAPVSAIGGSYSVDWSPAELGNFTVVASATDSLGYSNFSNAVVISAAPVAIYSGAVVSAANFAQGVAPGELVSIFGGGFCDGALSSSTIPLPLALGGASVTFNSIPAPLLFISPTQINVQVPWGVDVQGAAIPVVHVVVSTPSGVAESDAVLSATAPSVFRMPGGNRAVAFHSDGSLVGPSGSTAGPTAAPARVGELISILGTGFGSVTPVATAGDNSLDVLRRADVTPSVTIGGTSAVVAFAGLAPQFVGVDQLNVVVPDGVDAGDSVLLIVSGPKSGDAATLAIVK